MQQMTSQDPAMKARWDAFMGKTTGTGGNGQGAAGAAIRAGSTDNPSAPQTSSNDPANYTTFGGTGPNAGVITNADGTTSPAVPPGDQRDGRGAPPGSATTPTGTTNDPTLPGRTGGTGGTDTTRGGAGPATPGDTTGTGVVNSATGMPPPPSTASESINPVTADVTANQTVQGQLGDILKSGNPLLEAAKARAMQTANARGLQNSSMASQGGEEAIVNAALPIAQADAATQSKQALTNQTITNEFLSMDKGKTIDLEKAYAAFQQNNYTFDKDNALKKYIADAGNSTQMKVAAMQQEAQAAQLENALALAGISNSAALARQLESQDYTTKQNLLQLKSNNFTNYTSAMNTLLNADLDPADKKNKIDIMNQQYAGVPMPDGWMPSIFNGAPGSSNTPTTDAGGGGGGGGGDGTGGGN